mgnify:CR=1 FL=1
MKDNSVIRKNPDVVVRTMEDETILMPLCSSADEIDCIYTLNDAGSRVWELCDGKNTFGYIKNVLLDEFDSTPAELNKELGSFLEELIKMKALI